MAMQNHPRTPTFDRLGHRDRVRIERAAARADEMSERGGIVLVVDRLLGWKWVDAGGSVHRRLLRSGAVEICQYVTRAGVGEAAIREYIAVDLVDAGLATAPELRVVA